MKLELLEDMGYDNQFFRLPLAVSAYYTFDTYKRHQQPSSWSIIGCFQQKGNNEFIMEMQILYIDEDTLSYEPFLALRDADSYIYLHFSEFQALIDFIEEKYASDYIPFKGGNLEHFQILQREELLRMHFSEEEVSRAFSNYYRYIPSSYVQPVDQISIICLPSWIYQGRVSPGSTLTFATFNQKKLERPLSQILDEEWCGSMRFNMKALGEFLFLLKQRERATLISMEPDL